MCNTLFYAAILIVLGVIVNGLAGYALAKINFPFRERWLLIIMLLMIVPMETIITIHFLIIAKLGLLNTVLGYVLPMIVNPFASANKRVGDLLNIVLWCNGSTTDSGPVCPGSNPGRTT